jgi:hypothetical protein
MYSTYARSSECTVRALPLICIFYIFSWFVDDVMGLVAEEMLLKKVIPCIIQYIYTGGV